jgi:hypothetical protein
VTEDKSEQPAKADGSRESRAALNAGYNSYRSLADSNLIVVVPNGVVPPFRFKAGGWELLQSSIDLSSELKARIAETGFLMQTADSTSSGDLIPSNHNKPEPPSLEIEFALVIARMIDSVKNSPEDIRQVIYDLARYKLREQLPHANAEEKQHTQQALESAIRGVEAFSEKRVNILAPALQSQLNGHGTASADRRLPVPELIPQVGPRSRLNVDSQRNAGGSEHSHTPWPHLRRTAAMIAIVVAILVAVQQQERLLSLAHNLPKLGWKTAIDERRAPSQVSNHSALTPPPAKPAALRPTDYGVYATDNDALIELSLLPGRPLDIRVPVSAALKIPSRTILPNGHPRFIVFRRDLASSIADRAEVRIIAKVAREFSGDVIGKKPGDDSWVIRNISFPFRSSPVNDNPEMYELHSEDPALELTPGRYALVLKTQAYDFSVAGEAVDPRQCIERIVASEGTFYSNCKKP